jgi:hypothetical protein
MEGSRKVELVFRSVGERTSEIALELAKKYIQPDVVHVIENVKPFAKAMEVQMEIEYTGDYIVFMDADCLLLEDIRPFIERTKEPFVDCYVVDRFRGRVHLGLHITRLDVVQEMQQTEVPPDDIKYILRPESRRRNFALQHLGLTKSFKSFFVLHDFCQSLEHIWAKYALRELRSRVSYQRARLDEAMESWDFRELDFQVAKDAIEYTQKAVPDNSDPHQVEDYIRTLPELANQRLKSLSLPAKKKLEMPEVKHYAQSDFVQSVINNGNQKIFCIGLSRTGTKSLTKALAILGYDVIHYPADEETFEELAFGNYQLSILDYYDGIADITVAPFYAQLEKEYPNALFILTRRDKREWLDAMRKHWYKRPAFDEKRDNDPETAVFMKMRRFLRAAMYGTYVYQRKRMSHVYDEHYAAVERFFSGEKAHKLLKFNIFEGDGWEKLCAFLGQPVPREEFVHIRKKKQLEPKTVEND